ncbi:MAG: hypothetical protein JOZ87_26650 [Chloroflexi bacterium]|nr:hypothetical protein [Chloroflexota bacterium]
MVVAQGIADVCLLSRNGVVRCRVDGARTQVEVLGEALAGENIRSIVADPLHALRLYACSTTEVYRSDDGGLTWQWLPAGGLTYREFWTMAVHPTRPDELYVGTLPAAVFVSQDGGKSFRELSGIRDLPDFPRWTFPPPPHDSHPRVIALSAAAPDEIVVGIEEGGVIVSMDRGTTWRDISGPPDASALPSTPNPTGLLAYEPSGHIEGRVHRDVHWLVRDPRRTERLFATTGRGTYRTDDGGQHWRRLEYGIGGGYAVPIALHPDGPERLFVGAAENGPPAWKGPKGPRTGPFTASRYSRDLSEQVGGAHAWVLRTEDAGETWHKLENGLPTEYPYMISGLAIDPADPDAVYATYTDGSVFASSDAGSSWSKLMQGPPETFGIVLFQP